MILVFVCALLGFTFCAGAFYVPGLVVFAFPGILLILLALCGLYTEYMSEDIYKDDWY